jgi:hypothetical protein
MVLEQGMQSRDFFSKAWAFLFTPLHPLLNAYIVKKDGTCVHNDFSLLVNAA